MHRINSRRPSSIVRSGTPSSNAPPVILHAPYIEPGSPGHASPLRQLAIPAKGIVPSFDTIFDLAINSALVDEAVLVICLVDQVLAAWQQRLQERSRPVAGLDLLDGQHGESTDWRAFFCSKSYDVIILHGARQALQTQNLPIWYAKRLIDSVPRGLVVLA